MQMMARTSFRIPPLLARAALPLIVAVVGCLWVTFVLQAWRGSLSSDQVVPYIMTLEAWQPQDFFYWGQTRFGSLYVTFWKTCGHLLFGSGVGPFYLVHFGLYFVALGFWLAALRSWLPRVLFLVIWLPVSEEFLHYYLFPGQLYGLLFVLAAFTAWAVTRPWPINRLAFVLGLVSGLAYWQHELAGALIFGLSCAALRPYQVLGCFRREAWPLWGRFALGFLPPVIFAEIARRWSAQWAGNFEHYAVEAWPDFVTSLQVFLGRGFVLQNARWFGLLLLYASFLAPVFLTMQAIRRWRTAEPSSSAEQADITTRLDAMAWAFSLALPLFVLVVLDNPWFRLNGRSIRYFQFLIPWAVFFWAAYAWPTPPLAPEDRRPRWFARGLMILLAALAFVGIPSKDILLSAANRDARRAVQMEREARAKGIEDAGCSGFLGGYWSAYMMKAFFTNGVTASAYDVVRNPVLLERTWNQPVVCIESQFKDKALAESARRGKVCAESGGDLICRSQAGGH